MPHQWHCHGGLAHARSITQRALLLHGALGDAGERGDTPLRIKPLEAHRALGRQKLSVQARVRPVGPQRHLRGATQRHDAQPLSAQQLQVHRQRAAAAGARRQGRVDVARIGAKEGTRTRRHGRAVDLQHRLANAPRVRYGHPQQRRTALDVRVGVAALHLQGVQLRPLGADARLEREHLRGMQTPCARLQLVATVHRQHGGRDHADASDPRCLVP